MNKLIILIATAICFALSPNLIAQPEMSLWWTTHAHGQAKSSSNPNAEHQATQLDCGQEIYFRHSDQTAGSYDFVIHILNEGDEDLVISTPTMTDKSPEFTLEAYGMSGDITIIPNQELEIIVKYDSPAAYRSAEALLSLSSNDSDFESCSLVFDVGVRDCPTGNDSDDNTGTYFEVVTAYHNWTNDLNNIGGACFENIGIEQNHGFGTQINCDGKGEIDRGYQNPSCCAGNVAAPENPEGLIVVLDGVGEIAPSTAENGGDCHCEATFSYTITNDMTIVGTEAEVNAAYIAWYNSIEGGSCPSDGFVVKVPGLTVSGLSPLVGCSGMQTLEFDLCNNVNVFTFNGGDITDTQQPPVAEADGGEHCTATFTYTIKPTAEISGGGNILCSGASAPKIKLTLDGSGPWDVTYRVNNRNTTISVATSPHSFEPTIAGTYSLVSVVSDGGCAGTVSGEAVVTAQECLDQEDFKLTDPCSCDNPLNVRLADGTQLFHDILRIVGSTPSTTHRLTVNDGNLLTAAGTPIAVNTVFTEDPASLGDYELVFYTRELVPATISAGNVTTTKSFTTASCTCQVVPTMGEWGLVCLSLLLLIVGVTTISQRSLIVDSKSKL